MDPERRSSVRIKKTLELQYLSEIEPGSSSWVMGISRDISETGMCFTSDKSFFQRQMIRIRIKFPFNPFDWVELTARCVNIKGLSVGIYIVHVEFLELQNKQKQAIREYLEWVAKKDQESK